MSGHICPGCGTERGAAPEGGRPGCGCAERAVEAVRAERAAEVAAAEDFDPLRIRPYVTLPEPDEQGGEVAAGEGAPGDAHLGGAGPDGLPGPRPTLPVSPGPADDPGPDSTAVIPAGAVTAPPLPPDPGEEPPVRRRARPALWFAVAVAAATVGTVAFAGGLFSADHEPDRALPATVTSAPGPSREPVARASATAAPVSRTPSASATASRSASPSPSRTPSADATPSASKTLQAPPPPPPSTTRATGTVDTTPEQDADALSMGDSGPEVVELQDRLGQVWLYHGPDDGSYSTDVEQAVRSYQLYMSIEDDPEGTYGPHTRRALEASTKEPGRD